jgi:pyruvate kinase
MARIIESAENGNPGSIEGALTKWVGKQSGRVSIALCEAAAFAAEEMNAKTIAVFTESGLMARRLSALRPTQRIIALTQSKEVMNELSLMWGIHPLLHQKSATTEDMLKTGEQTLVEAGSVQQGETLVMMAGRLSGLGLSSSVTLYTIGKELSATVK